MHVSSVTMTSVAITEVRITVICCGSSSLDESGPSSLVVANVLELGLTEDEVSVFSGDRIGGNSYKNGAEKLFCNTNA